MSTCEELQRRLAEDGPEAVLADQALSQHLRSCADCTAALRRFRALDEALLAAPDAGDEVVARTLEAVKRTEGARAGPAAGLRGRPWAGALAAAVIIAAVFGLSHDLLKGSGTWDELAERQIGQSRRQLETVLSEAAVDELEPGGYFERTNEADRPVSGPRASTAVQDDEKARDPVHALRQAPEKEDRDYLAKAPAERELLEPRRDLAAAELGAEARLLQRLQQLAAAGIPGETGERHRAAANMPVAQSAEGSASVSIAVPTAESTSVPKPLPVPNGRSKESASPVGEAKVRFENQKSEVPHRRIITGGGRLAAIGEEAREPSGSGDARERASLDQSAAQPPLAPGAVMYRRAFGDDPAFGVDAEQARRQARTYLERIAALDDLSFRPASGYWANTYIPGDPDMRLLQARLSGWDRRQFGQASTLDQAVRPVTQPFDAPSDAALALYLDADAAAVRGPTRLRLQVGLKGAERQSGHRPAMNVGLVIDGRELGDAALGARVRALIAAMVRARQAGDRFSLSVAGPGGGTVVGPEAFRHGPLQVAMQRLLDDRKSGGDAASAGLIEAVRLAADSVRQGDRENAILGTSVVLLATGATLDGELPALEALAHENAVGGVPMSVIALAPAVDAADLDRLVAAGQGNRRRLFAGDAADAVVEAELHAAARVVARAVRLRIRLAPGVKLVDVLGSRRLEEPQAARVRQAEQAIDRRLAANLGITADRGADEEGIQVVIPNFYAGDAHVVLLDVVAERAGPIADVTARYKDVVRLKNGVAHARLELGNEEKPLGPLERNVQKNRLAWELAQELRRLGRELEAGFDPDLTLQMAGLRDLVLGLRLEVPGWAADADLAEDQAVLQGYLAALGSPLAQDRRQQILLGQSLRHLSFAKLHTRRD